jgi:hypothetical protein
VSIFQRSPYYRTDIWFGRFVASPVTAILSLAAGAAMVAALHSRPVLEFGWWWAAFAIFPGIWLFFASLIYLMHLTFWAFGSDATRGALGEQNLKGTIFRREGLALAVSLGIVVAATAWSQAGPVGSERFHNCVKGLREPGLRALAKSMSNPVTAAEFGTLCGKAYSVDAEGYRVTPTSPEDLVKRYGQ